MQGWDENKSGRNHPPSGQRYALQDIKSPIFLAAQTQALRHVPRRSTTRNKQGIIGLGVRVQCSCEVLSGTAVWRQGEAPKIWPWSSSQDKAVRLRGSEWCMGSVWTWPLGPGEPALHPLTPKPHFNGYGGMPVSPCRFLLWVHIGDLFSLRPCCLAEDIRGAVGEVPGAVFRVSRPCTAGNSQPRQHLWFACSAERVSRKLPNLHGKLSGMQEKTPSRNHNQWAFFQYESIYQVNPTNEADKS